MEKATVAGPSSTVGRGGETVKYVGSSYFRQRLVLSTLSGKPVTFTDIRCVESRL
jgi:RNA 3'-terminal phosphate cyclase